MYKLTQFGSSIPIYDSENNPLPEGKVYFHTHQMLWKDNVFIGKVYINTDIVYLLLENGSKLVYPRSLFQDLFMRNAQIIELIYRANSVTETRLQLKGHRLGTNYSEEKMEKAFSVRLFSIDQYGAYHFYGDLYYWFTN